MLRLIPCATLAALISATAFASGYLDPRGGAMRSQESFDARWMAVNAELGAFRGGVRQDRLAPPQSAASQTIMAIKLVSQQTGAIVFQDQAGRVLFRNDPAAQTTTVVKGLVVPNATGLRPQPARRNVVRENEEKKKLPDACESAFSAVAAPALAHIPGRCMA
jgi:hypothetical protein